MKQILIVGFNGILDTGWVKDQKMIKDKLIDRKSSKLIAIRSNQKQISQDG